MYISIYIYIRGLQLQASTITPDPKLKKMVLETQNVTTDNNTNWTVVILKALW